jgi:hypothetical protein
MMETDDIAEMRHELARADSALISLERLLADYHVSKYGRARELAGAAKASYDRAIVLAQNIRLSRRATFEHLDSRDEAKSRLVLQVEQLTVGDVTGVTAAVRDTILNMKNAIKGIRFSLGLR